MYHNQALQKARGQERERPWGSKTSLVGMLLPPPCTEWLPIILLPFHPLAKFQRPGLELLLGQIQVTCQRSSLRNGQGEEGSCTLGFHSGMQGLELLPNKWAHSEWELSPVEIRVLRRRNGCWAAKSWSMLRRSADSGSEEEKRAFEVPQALNTYWEPTRCKAVGKCDWRYIEV